MRLPSATLGIGGMLVCYAYGAALFEPIVGLPAALMLGTSIQYLQAATNARVDMTFTFFLEVAFFEFLLMAEGLTSRWLLLYLAVAGAVLSKGPVGVVLPAGGGDHLERGRAPPAERQIASGARPDGGRVGGRRMVRGGDCNRWEQLCPAAARQRKLLRLFPQLHCRRRP